MDAVYEFRTFAFAGASLLAGLIGFFFCTDPALKKRVGRYFIVLLLGTQAAAFLSPNILIYNVAVGAALLLGCPDRRMIAPTYLFLLVTLPLPSTGVSLGGTYLMGYDASISLGIAGAILIAVKGKRNVRRSRHWDMLALILFLLSVLPTARDTTFTNILRITLDAAAAAFLPYYVISRSMLSFDDVRDALYGFVAGITALSVLAVYEIFHTWPLYRIVPNHYGLGSGHMMVKMRGGFLRAFGPYPESTSFALCLAIGLVVAYGCRRIYGSRIKQMMVLAVITAGVLAPQSRGAWLGVAAGIAAIDLYDRQVGALIRKAALGAGAFVLLLGVSTVLPAVRVVPGMSDEGSDTVDYRSDLLTRGLQEIRKHPIVGDTPNNVRFAMRDMTQGEGIIDFVNTFLYMGLIAGIPGFLAFVYMLVSPMFGLWFAKGSFARRHFAAFRRTSSASAIFGGLAAMAVMLSVTALVNRTTTLTMVLIGLAAVVMNTMGSARGLIRRSAAAGPQEGRDGPRPPVSEPQALPA